MKYSRFLWFLSCVAIATTPAQELGEVAYIQAMKDIENPFRMMCVAAHPDDEDGATLAYYRMLHGVTTHAVIATRGEGGQNEIGPELYNELGVIRTHEMKAAAEIEGAELHFLDLPEFGYSKTAEETFEVWGREVALERMVRVIRETRPHVIITHHGRVIDHGHHQAIGAIVEEAFDVAADPDRFPEHAKAGLDPWAVSRLYIRDFRVSKGMALTNISALEPVRGRTIAEIAASALEVHESQGMAYFIDVLLSGRQESFYQLVKNRATTGNAGATASKAGHGPLFDGLPLPENADLAPTIPENQDRAVQRAALFDWLSAHGRFQEGSLEERWQWEEVNRAASIASELKLTAKPDDTLVTAGQDIAIEVSLSDFGSPEALKAEVTLNVIYGMGEIGNHRLELPFQQSRSGDGTFTFTIPQNAPLTVPHAPRLFDKDFLRPQLEVQAKIHCVAGPVLLTEPVYLDIAPRIGVAFPDAPYLLRTGSDSAVEVSILATNHTSGPLSDYLSFTAPPGWRASPERLPVSFSKEGEQRLVPFVLTPTTALESGDYHAGAGITGAGAKSPVLLRAIDVTVPSDRRVGVIQSYDTTFVSTLEKLGVPNETLELADFRAERLDRFDTIIVDIRAYQYRPDLAANNSALLDYVSRGGTLLVMYQKTFDWNSDFAPYPITLSRNRVTREDAPMEILAPQHPFFTTPNTIDAQDWTGWIQERGLYFPDSWHDQYTALIQTQDPGESIPPGSCLIAQHGEGTYLYTALGWYRQLRELHPGALRCFANMLAL